MEAQFALTEKRPRPQLPAITISREAGAGAITIGHLAAKILDQRFPGGPACPWMVFERNLVEQILQDHKLPAALERFMPEDATFPLNDAVAPTRKFFVILNESPTANETSSWVYTLKLFA
jgi:hypothetical protein